MGYAEGARELFSFLRPQRGIVASYDLRNIESDSFRTNLQRARIAGLDKSFMHSCTEFAEIAIKELFIAAMKNHMAMKFVSRTFHNDLYKKFQDDVMNVMDTGQCVQAMIVRHDAVDIRDNIFLKLIASHSNGSVLQHEKTVEQGSFILVGEDFYRVAASNMRDRSRAYVNFGDRAAAAGLAKDYAKLLEKEPVELDAEYFF